MSNPRIALVIAATLVIAVLPAIAAPTGVELTAADDRQTAQPVRPQQSTVDGALHSGETIWQGRQLTVDASNLDTDTLAVC